ncbi:MULTISPECIES: AmiS/UreI family transporter [Actinomadura]|uniref:AmiS/UreI family transporter n=1 Tax=Actinomadura yumaensis TaxID=111807 RepID=A0ABW2CHD4_9ACTN|nr:AmiS/UreI family transporter [Actinomadura sp. J1-007]MWK40128.1 transporter [Actinomadura sp. J1-007]
MASVGLLYVGAVLFVNALMLLGRVEPRSAAVLNLFVGTLQVVLPTLLLVAADGDTGQIGASAGLYLFGFTYLYVGIGTLAGLDTSGVGWFSLFVAVAAVGFGLVSFVDEHDYPLGVIWLLWSFLWLLYFAVFGLKRERLTGYAAWVTLVEAWLTAVLPAFLLLTDRYTTSGWFAAGLGAVCVAAFAVLWRFAGPARTTAPGAGGPGEAGAAGGAAPAP